MQIIERNYTLRRMVGHRESIADEQRFGTYLIPGLASTWVLKAEACLEAVVEVAHGGFHVLIGDVPEAHFLHLGSGTPCVKCCAKRHLKNC